MKARTWYLVIAIVLTVLNVVLAARYVTVASTTSATASWSEPMFVVTPLLGGTALANLWTQAIVGLFHSVDRQCVKRGAGAAFFPGEMRGEDNV